MLEPTCVPCAACCTLREISWVAAPTADAIVVAISDIFSDGVADILDGDDRLIGRGLDSCDVTADLAGGVGGLLGERLDLGGNDGETAASLARAGGFDRRVQGPRRLVCPAMVLMSSSTSPMRAAA